MHLTLDYFPDAAALFDEIVESGCVRAAEDQASGSRQYITTLVSTTALPAVERHHRRRDEVFRPQIRCAHAHRGIDKVASPYLQTT